jgi:hypothetical protein
MTQSVAPESKKAELTKGPSFGSSAIFSFKDPPLSVPFSRRVWLFQVSLSHYCISVNTSVKHKNVIVHVRVVDQSHGTIRACISFRVVRIRHYRFPFVMWHDGGEARKRDYRKNFSTHRSA